MLNVKCYELRKDKYCLGNLKTGNKIIAKQETSCVHQARACPSKWWRWSRCAMCSAGCGLQSLATNWPNYGPAVCKVSEEKINTSCTPRHVSWAACHVSRSRGHVSPAACPVSRAGGHVSRSDGHVPRAACHVPRANYGGRSRQHELTWNVKYCNLQRNRQRRARAGRHKIFRLLCVRGLSDY